MSTVRVVDDPSQAALLAAPLRRRILDSLARPGSASSVARSLGVARQLVAYHLRRLESAGYVRLHRAGRSQLPPRCRRPPDTRIAEEIMTKEVKSERTLEMHVDVDAPIEAAWKAVTEAEGLANWFSPVAKVSGPGLNSQVTAAWSEEMAFTMRVDAWEPNHRVRWISEDIMGP